MTTVAHNHIVLDDQGVAWIDGTQTKVLEIALDHIAWNLSPAQIHEAYPPLSLAQIHAALTHYYDNKTAFDAEITASAKRADAFRTDSLDSPLRRQLREKGLI